MADLKTSVIIDLAGNLQSRARTYSNSLKQFSDRSRRSLRGVRRASLAAARGISRLGNRYTALATGAAGAGTVKMLIGLEQRMTRLGITAGKTQGQMNALKHEIFNTALKVRVDPSDLIAAGEQILARTGDFKLFQDNLDNIATVMQASGAAGRDVGQMVSDLDQKFHLKGKDEYLRAFDTLNILGKSGSFELKDMATQGAGVTAVFNNLSKTGLDGVRQMGATLQVVQQGFGNAAEAATGFKRLVSVITGEGLQKLQKNGIVLLDEEKTKKAGHNVFRDLSEIIKDIIRATKGDADKLGKIFPDLSKQALSPFAEQFKSTGGFAEFDKLLKVQGDGAATMLDAATAAKTASAALENLFTVWKKFADAELTGPIQSLADSLNSMDPDRVMAIMKALAIGVTGLVVVPKVFRGLRSLSSLVRGKGGAAGALGAAAGGGGMPVFVTNWPGGAGLAADAGLGGGGGKGVKKTLRGLRATGRLLTRAPNLKSIATLGAGAVGTAGAAVGAAGLAGYGAGTLIAKSIEDTSFYDRLGSALATALAAAGVDSAKQAKENEKKGRMSGVLDIKVTTDKGAQATVRKLRTENMDLDIDAGAVMVGPG